MKIKRNILSLIVALSIMKLDNDTFQNRIKSTF